MNKKKLMCLATAMFCFMLMLNFSQAGFAADSAPAREKVVYSAGYDTDPEDFNPWSGNPAYGVAFMYETLFGYNYASDTLLPVLGESYAWADDGESITVTLDADAEWNDGTAVSADDVVYSFNLMMNTTKFGDGMKKRIDSVVAGTGTVTFNLNATFKNSIKLFEYLTDDCYIVPKALWTDLVACEFGGNITKLNEFTNDMFANETLQVFSGPYQPYYRDVDKTIEVYEYRAADWWGYTVLDKDVDTNIIDHTTSPEYIGCIQYPDNPAKDKALLTNEIDIHAGYIDMVWKMMGKNSEISTWYGTEYPYYLSLGAVIEIAPNLQRYPFVEKWFREVMAYAQNYDQIGYSAASGYPARARPGYIDDRSAAQKAVYDPAVTAEYEITYNTTKAVEILKEHCYQDAAGAWYTNDVPAAYASMPNVQDDDGVHGGTNVKLGGWDIIVPAGWTDVVIGTKMWSEYLNDINVSIGYEEVDFWNKWRTDGIDGTFDIMMQCCGPHLVNPAQTVWGGYVGTNYPWANVTRWENKTFEETVDSYETLPLGSTEQKAAASKAQAIMADAMPAVPTLVNGYWYTVNTKYWEGYASEANEFQQIQAAYAINNAAVKRRSIMCLYEAGTKTVAPEVVTVTEINSAGETVVVTSEVSGGVTTVENVATTTKSGSSWTGLTLSVFLTLGLAALFLRKRRY